jgi:hypothetical protein
LAGIGERGFQNEEKYGSLLPTQDVGVGVAWRQGHSYPEDLRARVLAAVDGGMAARAAAKVFRVSEHDADIIVQQCFKASGSNCQTGWKPALG